MRILLDTNVWLSAFFTEGFCQRFIEVCVENHLVLSSDYIIQEFQNKISLTKFELSEIQITKAVDFIRVSTEVISSIEPLGPICRDPKDDLILAAALSGRAGYIVTGDKDLLVLESFQKIPIVSPRDFWKLEQASILN